MTLGYARPNVRSVDGPPFHCTSQWLWQVSQTSTWLSDTQKGSPKPLDVQVYRDRVASIRPGLVVGIAYSSADLRIGAFHPPSRRSLTEVARPPPRGWTRILPNPWGSSPLSGSGVPGLANSLPSRCESKAQMSPGGGASDAVLRGVMRTESSSKLSPRRWMIGWQAVESG